MGQPSFAASNAIIYVTYGFFLCVKTRAGSWIRKKQNTRILYGLANVDPSVMGTGIAWRMRKQPNTDFLAGNRTQTGQKQTDDALALFSLSMAQINPVLCTVN